MQGTIASILVALLLIMSVPAVSASTVNIALNSSSGVARVTGISTTKIVFAYPANSTISNALKAYTYSMQVSGNVAKGEASSDDFQDMLRNYTPSISVQNMSTSLSTIAVGNATALVVTRITNLTAYVTGVFNVTNGKVMANLEWKAFTIRGSFEVPMDGNNYDMNLLGSAVMAPLGGEGMVASFLGGSFGRDNIWSSSTINYSALSSPLSNWTRVYDASTNTTTFSKTVKAQSNYSSSISLKGQAYSLSMVSDPSSTVEVLGYASPSGNSLIIESPPLGTVGISTILVLVAFIIVAVGAYLAIRRRARPSTGAPFLGLTSSNG